MRDQSHTFKNLESAFAGESMANRKYLFFAEVMQRLGFKDLAKLFKETAAQETEHAFAHFELLHPELTIADPAALTEEAKLKIASQCLHLAIAGETYEYMTMYPEFATMARQDQEALARAEFEAQIQESQEHAEMFRRAAHRFGLLTPVEHHHADRYAEALNLLQGGVVSEKQVTQKWICKQCSVIYDPIVGDPDSGIVPGTPFEEVPEDWCCPICGATKKMFVPHLEAIAV